MKHFFSSIIIGAVATTSMAFGDVDQEISESRIAHIEKSLQEHTQLFENLTAHSQYGSNTPSNDGSMNTRSQNTADHSAHGCVDQGFTIQATFLYWKATLDTLEYVGQSNGVNILASTHADFREPDFEYDPGVRVGLGYDFGQSNWDVNLA